MCGGRVADEARQSLIYVGICVGIRVGRRAGEISEFPLEMMERRKQLLAMARVRGGLYIFQDAGARQFQALAFASKADLFGRQGSLLDRCTVDGRFFHLRFDGFTLPASGHDSIILLCKGSVFLPGFY